MRLAVFASGGGSNLGAILDAIDAGRLQGVVAVVVTDRGGIGALERAEARGIPTEIIAPARLPDQGAFTTQLLDTLARHEIHVVALAGYLKKIPAPVVQAYPNRILNIHPSLLPAFGGAGLFGERVHRAVLEYGAQFSGATVHLVDEDFDTGPVVLQETVPVHEDDTPATLAARVLAVEHELYPLALSLLADGRLRLDGRLVRITTSAR
ncbi:MAG: phosphoribosylglycinamide formyltransferase [Bacteroidota bacterium]